MAPPPEPCYCYTRDCTVRPFRPAARKPPGQTRSGPRAHSRSCLQMPMASIWGNGAFGPVADLTGAFGCKASGCARVGRNPPSHQSYRFSGPQDARRKSFGGDQNPPTRPPSSGSHPDAGGSRTGSRKPGLGKSPAGGTRWPTSTRKGKALAFPARVASPPCTRRAYGGKSHVSILPLLS